MLEKLLLAVTITFCLKLFLVAIPASNSSSGYHLLKTSTLANKSLFSAEAQRYLPSPLLEN